MAPIYGEQQAAAFRRLRKEIREITQDQGSSSDGGKRQALMDSLRFDQIDARYATIKNAHAKTCKWLLRKSEHTEWLDPTRLSSHHGFLWIKGKPGTGKSTLMKFAFGQASKSRKSNVVIAFFFNARGETLEKTIIGMYRSLLLQLLEKIPTLQCNSRSLSLVPSSISADYQWTRHSLEDQLQQAVLGLGDTPVICFIDALDECEQWQVRSMISFFENLGELAVSSGRSFRVCLSSRHYPEVTIRRGISLVLEGQEGHTQDINNYLESALRIGTSASAQKIRKDLQEKSSGVFMWIVLVVDILNEEYDGGRMYALERRLKQIPADLHALFQDILTRDSNDKEELILCLQWVLFAKQPLQPEQLYLAILAGTEPGALATQHDQEVTLETIRKFLLRSSKGLTEITKTKNKKVQFIHESVRDFLLKENGLSKIWPEFADNFQGQSHDRLRQCCLNYVSIDVATPLELPDHLPDAGTRSADRLRVSAASKFPFLEYAVQNVLYHADAAEGGGISQADFLNSFPHSQWVKLNNLFEKHQVRRHTETVSLLYILAELNMVNLIRVLGSASCCLDVEAERYGCPLFAAAATSSEQAFELCMESIQLQQAYSSLVATVGEQYFQHKSVQYLFLVERAHILRAPYAPRYRDLLWLLSTIAIVVCLGAICIAGIVSPKYVLSEVDGRCRIGLQRYAAIPLLTCDIVINLYLTTVFIYLLSPLVKDNTSSGTGAVNRVTLCISKTLGRVQQKATMDFHRSNKALVKRVETLLQKTLIGCVLVILPTGGNLAAICILVGKKLAFICLTLCTFDVTWAAIVFHWLTIVGTDENEGATPA
ncbi:unnamed protein product [Alternaria alternata]